MTGPTQAELTQPADSDWPMSNRDYRGQRYSALKGSTADNAASLQPVCVAQLGETGPFQTSPVVYQGTIYVTTPRSTYAPVQHLPEAVSRLKLAWNIFQERGAVERLA
ncbi:hypothetical protein Q0M94_18695 (plasmid) [Deinococcus radiomollis]|uniref:hypothetical protein n=1 Tax=Deinococcus radiomollis TaxID=468916 RepID=UPI0038911AD2